ncbi:MAG: hypothetical protein WKG06_15110 [Segetibacter sp.]
MLWSGAMKYWYQQQLYGKLAGKEAGEQCMVAQLYFKEIMVLNWKDIFQRVSFLVGQQEQRSNSFAWLRQWKNRYQNM